MQVRTDGLRARRLHDRVADEVVTVAEIEIDRSRRFADVSTQAFFIVRPTG